MEVEYLPITDNFELKVVLLDGGSQVVAALLFKTANTLPGVFGTASVRDEFSVEGTPPQAGFHAVIVLLFKIDFTLPGSFFKIGMFSFAIV